MIVKNMRNYVVKQELYKMDEIKFIKTFEKVFLPPDRLLEVVTKNIPIIDNKEIKKEIKQRGWERQKKMMKQIQRQEKKPDVFIR